MTDPLAPLYETPCTDAELERVFQWLKSLGDQRDHQGVDFNRLADWGGTFLEYTTPRETFTPTSYEKFYDWFLRRMTPEVETSARYRATASSICSPAESIVRYEGHIGDGLIELKQGPADVLRVLRELEPEAGDFRFVRLGLHKCHYHHIHSPVDGQVVHVQDFERGTGAFGDNTVTLFQIQSNVGPVFLAAIGERTVQSFQRIVNVGDTLRKVDELGWFWWGSMVLIAFPGNLSRVNSRDQLFVGDPVAG